MKKAIVTETSYDFGIKKPPLIVVIPLYAWKGQVFNVKYKCQELKDGALKECLENMTLSADEILLNQKDFSFTQKVQNYPTVSSFLD